MNKKILSITALIFITLSVFCTNLSASVQNKNTSAPLKTTEQTKAIEQTKAVIQLSDIIEDPSTLEPVIPHAMGSGITLRVFTIILEFLANQRNSLTEAGATSLINIITLILAYPEMLDSSDDYLTAKTKLTELLDTLNS